MDFDQTMAGILKLWRMSSPLVYSLILYRPELSTRASNNPITVFQVYRAN